MPIHVAILKRGYLDAILRGDKTVESRLAKVQCAPFGAVMPGERLFLKASGGPFVATATAAWVRYDHALTPARVVRLGRRFGKAIGADPAFWRAKAHARCSTLIGLTGIEPLAVGPTYDPAHLRAWYVLPDAASPLWETELTAGAIRNRYVRTTGHGGFFPPGPIELRPAGGGDPVRTELGPRGMLRWRGWGRWFARWGAQPGDRIRFVRIERRCYSFVILGDN